jgi:hypothetical protein
MTKDRFSFPLPSFKHHPLWALFDSQDRFMGNLKKQPTDWIYRTKTIRYDLNSLGHRCPEPENISWNDSLVVLGCSMAYGAGLCEEDTLPAKLGSILGIPAINLGRPGGSCNLVRMQASLMLRSGYRPKGVVILWTLPGRFTFLDEHEKVPVVLGPWTLNNPTAPTYHKNLLESWMRNGNHLEQSKQEAITTRILLEAAGIPTVEATYWPHVASNIGCRLLEIVDLARDLSHPGIETTAAAARILATEWFDILNSN